MFTTPGGGSPSPGPSPGPTPGPAPSANDAIDVRGVSIVKGADIRGWAVTSTLTRVTVGNGQLCTEHTKAGRWPQLPFFSDPATVEGNQWVFANIGGRWYGGAGEWLRPGQTCKHIDSNFARDSFAGTVMASWYSAQRRVGGLRGQHPGACGPVGTAGTLEHRRHPVALAASLAGLWPRCVRPRVFGDRGPEPVTCLAEFAGSSIS